MVVLALTLASVLALPTTRPDGGPDATVRITVDSARHTVTIVSGPHQVPGMTPAQLKAALDDPEPMGGHHGGMEPFRTFDWPVDGWLRAVSMRLTDGQGREAPSRLIHHLNLISLDRRQLFYDMPERVIAIGQETGEIRLPASIGNPVRKGTHMGLALMWHNLSTVDYHDLTMTLTIEWMPTNMYPRPVDVVPIYLDVVNPIGRTVDFDLPTGRQQFHADFTMPIDGRVIGVGGHLHDYGTGLDLLDLTGGQQREVVHLDATLDRQGRISGVERKFPGVSGRGIKLTKGHVYRFLASYDNTGGRFLKDGAMAHMILLFVPDDPDQWPAVNRASTDWKTEVAALEALGKEMPGMPGMGAGHQHP